MEANLHITVEANTKTFLVPLLNQAFLTLVLPRYDEGTICTVSGWGTTTEGGSLARVLQKVNMIIIHHGVRVDHVCDCDADALMLR